MFNDALYDYIVVGSGAGGGPLAANLARAGFRVALIEEGPDPRGEEFAALTCAVPAHHAWACADETISKQLEVQHFSLDQERAAKRLSFLGKDGRSKPFYRCARVLGGSPRTDDLITLYPHCKVFDDIQTRTGDASWSAANMRNYLQKLETCRYASPAPNKGRHGFSGWLNTTLVDSRHLLSRSDREMIDTAVRAAVETFLEEVIPRLASRPFAGLERVLEFFSNYLNLARSLAEHRPNALKAEIAAFQRELDVLRTDLNTTRQLDSGVPGARELMGQLLRRSGDALLKSLAQNQLFRNLLIALQPMLDPNDWQVISHDLPGIFATAIASDGVRRSAPDSYIRETQQKHPRRLKRIQARVIEIVIVDTLQRRLVACGVRAVRQGQAEPTDFYCKEEVILAAGTFATPEILLRSGIGPKNHLHQLGTAQK